MRIRSPLNKTLFQYENYTTPRLSCFLFWFQFKNVPAMRGFWIFEICSRILRVWSGCLMSTILRSAISLISAPAASKSKIKKSKMLNSVDYDEVQQCNLCQKIVIELPAKALELPVMIITWTLSSRSSWFKRVSNSRANSSHSAFNAWGRFNVTIATFSLILTNKFLKPAKDSSTHLKISTENIRSIVDRIVIFFFWIWEFEQRKEKKTTLPKRELFETYFFR